MQKIRAAIRTVAQEAGVSVVVHEGNEANLLVVLYHEPSVDLTERAIKEFDRQNH
jgi:Skp family chaperone for outer membrane proteins